MVYYSGRRGEVLFDNVIIYVRRFLYFVFYFDLFMWVFMIIFFLIVLFVFFLIEFIFIRIIVTEKENRLKVILFFL